MSNTLSGYTVALSGQNRELYAWPVQLVGWTGSTFAPLSVGASGAINVLPEGTMYAAVAAGTGSANLGGAPAKGDYLSGLLAIPATTSPGAIILSDGATNLTVFNGGSSSVSNLVPFFIPLGLTALNTTGWTVGTGTGIAVIAVGKFS